MYKAVFIDIDGTLRDDNKKISQRTIASIKKICSLGVYIILCTGRARDYAEAVSKECGASQYIITAGGSEVYDYQNDKVIYSNNIDNDAIEKLYNLAEKHNTKFMMSVNGTRVVKELTSTGGLETLLTEDIKDFIKKNNILQCIIMDTDFNKLKSMRECIEIIDGIKINNQSKSFNDNFIKPIGNLYFDITDFNSSKGDAIIEFCKHLNISIEDTIAIGDDFNDISMFEVVGHSIAMGNANEIIKKMVDEVIKSNNEDGVAEYFESLYSKYTGINS